MKLVILLLVLSTLLNCQNSVNKVNPKTKTQSKMNTKFQIGDCLIFQGNDDIYYGLILFEINITVENAEYSFLQCGKSFDSLPNHTQFINSGIFGNKVPSGSSPNPVIGFQAISITDESLEEMIMKIVKIGEIAIEDKPINLSGGGYAHNLESLTFSMALNFKMLDTKHSGFPYPKEIFTTSLLKPKNSNYTPKTPNQIWILSKKTAHPKALELLNEDYYWNQSDDYAPFGNDDGADALHMFQEWRTRNAKSNPIEFVNYLAQRWEHEISHLNEPDAGKIIGFFEDTFKQSFDDAIIGICFGQLVLEGKIEADLKLLGIAAIQRQLHTKICNQWASGQERSEKLNKELIILKEKL